MDNSRESYDRGALIKRVRERKRRRRRRIAIRALIVTLLLSVTAFCILSLTVLFRTEYVKIEGNSVYNDSEILNSAGIYKADNLLLLSEKKISERLEKSMPYISGVELKRVLPDTVVLTVTETKDEVCFNYAGKFYTADLNGKILSELGEKPQTLCQITVGEKTVLKTGEKINFDSNNEKELLSRYLELFEKNDFNINFINISDPYDSYMKIDNNYIVEFGSYKDFELKAAHLAATLPEMPANSTGVIDLAGWSTGKQEAYFTERSIADYKQ
ncbi:MAG: FtsQ-type POTRA domain-containing protein [Clostridia bacterium]|nr:FtsQ-type POTRA domain-containing protein [Clostridia bacterium]